MQKKASPRSFNLCEEQFDICVVHLLATYYNNNEKNQVLQWNTDCFPGPSFDNPQFIDGKLPFGSETNVLLQQPQVK